MTNADKFKDIFGLYATELWSMPEKDFLKWLNSEVSNYSEFPNNWIPVSERLPKEGVIVWVSADNEIWLLRRYGINWYQDGGGWALLTEEVDAWMPIECPTPFQPKEE
jgi:hypothetical protein